MAMSFRLSRCDYCPAEVIWAVTASNNRMMIDPSPRPDGNVVLRVKALGAPLAIVYGRPPVTVPAHSRYRPHWATCPGADQARQAARPAKAAAVRPAAPPTDTLF